MCGNMADIQSATAEIRRGKKIERKKERKKKPQGKHIMFALRLFVIIVYYGLPYYIGRP